MFSLFNNSAKLKDSIISVLFWGLAVLVAILPVLIITEIAYNGVANLSLGFLFDSPSNAGRSGGIFPLLVSTLWILAVCLLVVVPVGLGCAIYLSECVSPKSGIGRAIGFSLDVLSGVPSIVFGLFGYAVFAVQLGLGFSILSGGLSLACMVLPLFIRTSEQALISCPKAYRQAAEALNLSSFGFVTRILLPSASRGISAALIISIGRALAETAVLIFTAGYVTRMPASWMDSGRSLSVHIYDLSMNVPGGQANAATTALVLVLIIIFINISAHRLSMRWQTTT